jgi:hypothetical protein
MALVRDDVLQPPGPADRVFKIRTRAKQTDPPLPDVIRKDQVRGAYKSIEFEPEFVTVTLEAGRGHESPDREAADEAAAAKPAARLRRNDFPVENRTEFGVSQSKADLQARIISRCQLMLRSGYSNGTSVQRFLKAPAFASWPMAHKLADFHALVFLASYLDPATGAAVAKSVASGGPLDEGIQLLVDDILEG